MATQSSNKTIKILADVEAHARMFADKCLQARQVLERNVGSSPAPKREKALPAAKVIDIKNKRRKSVLKQALGK